MEYELLDTGVFDGDRYFDVFVEVAKQSPEDLLIQISAINRCPEAATLQVDRKSTRLNSSHRSLSRMPSSA